MRIYAAVVTDGAIMDALTLQAKRDDAARAADVYNAEHGKGAEVIEVDIQSVSRIGDPVLVTVTHRGGSQEFRLRAS